MTVTRRFGLGIAGLGAAGLGVAGLGVSALFAGSPYRHTPGRIDVARTVRAIDDGADHVPALQLAEWIRARKPSLRVIDVRPPEQFADYAIPTAENLPLDALMRTSFAPHETVVLYSEGGAHAGQAWVLLQALGVANATFIAGGLADWHDEVMAPVLRPGTDQRQQAELSRYFGGQPRLATDDDTDGGAPSPQPHRRFRRRGC